jgi:hypothetical protein
VVVVAKVSQQLQYFQGRQSMLLTIVTVNPRTEIRDEQIMEMICADTSTEALEQGLWGFDRNWENWEANSAEPGQMRGPIIPKIQ